MNKNISYLVLLLALGANTLIVELTIPRLIAPIFGNTLFSWTAIIAVVLVALTAGYRIGGMIATRTEFERYILWFSLFAAIWVLALSLGGDLLVQRMNWLNMMFGPLVAAAGLAAVPAFLDAAVVPLVIQALPGERGDVSGRCFAWSTVGSIFGVLATGYILLPQLGISGALVTGAALVALALLAMSRFGAAAGISVLCVVAIAGGPAGPDNLLVDKSNGYHRIRIVEQGSIRSLFLDNTLEGRVRLGEVTPVADYMAQAGRLIDQHAADMERPLDKVFVLGGGSFSIPRYVKHLNPQAVVRVAEVDPEVAHLANEYLELDNSLVNVSIGDGRQILAIDNDQYDLIVNDAFQGLRKIPFHLTTLEFNELVDARLSREGMYMANVRGDPRSSYLASSFVHTLSQTFPYIYAEKATASNFWVIAAKQPLRGFTPSPAAGTMARRLTDNHAPVEYLIVRDLVAQRLGR